MARAVEIAFRGWVPGVSPLDLAFAGWAAEELPPWDIAVALVGSFVQAVALTGAHDTATQLAGSFDDDIGLGAST